MRDRSDEDLKAEYARVLVRLGSSHGRTVLEALEDAEAIICEIKRRRAKEAV